MSAQLDLLFEEFVARGQRAQKAVDEIIRDKVADRARDVERLIPIMLDLAERAGPFDPKTKKGGVTVCNLRHAAVRAGVLTGGETGRTLSYLRQVPIKAKLHATGFYRMSDIPKSRNQNMVYELPPKP